MVVAAKLKSRKILNDQTKGHNLPRGENRDEFLYYVGVISLAKGKVDAVKKLLKQAKREAMDAGYNLADMADVMAHREDEPETVQTTIMRRARYAAWMHGTKEPEQADLFAEATSNESEKHYQEGREDALLGLPNKGDRYDTTTESGQQRMKGWNDGNDKRQALQAKQLEQFKANEKAEKEKQKAKAAKAEKKAKNAAAAQEATVQ